MDVCTDEEKETDLSPKRLKTCEENKDFISDLPDPILVHILSFLPLRDAIKTVLLRRFGNLWLSTPVLDLDNCLYHDWEDEDEDCEHEKFMDVIHQVWNHHDKITLDKLYLKFSFALIHSKNEAVFDHLDPEDYEEEEKEKEKEKEKAAADQIEKLIRYAISRKVKVLDLNFKGCACGPCGSVDRLYFYALPDIIISNHLTDLRLATCDIRSCRKTNLQALRVLILNKVSLSDEVMEKILLGCPLLEDLSMVECYGLGKLDCKNPNLKKLMLSLSKESRHLSLSCPHASSLEIAGWIERATLLNVTSLVDASIFFSSYFKCEQRPYIDVSRLLRMVRRCKTFTPCRWTILVLSIWKLINVPCQFFEWKNLILQLGLTKWHQPGLCFLLKSSRSLETLAMRFIPGWDYMFQVEPAQWIWEYDFDGDNYWDSQEATFPFLKSITIDGHINEPCVIKMVKFLLKSAPRLKKMVISTKNTSEPSVSKGEKDVLTSEQLLELSQKLLMFPRASSQAMIYFS